MIPYQPILQNLENGFNYQLDLLRLDLVDEEISGNKWFKLKQNLEKAISGKFETIITFGGAFSNHIAATASACKKNNLKCAGIIRGEAQNVLNPTLIKAKEDGMLLYFVSREMYSKKEEDSFKNYLDENFKNYYLIPEGGNNKEGVLGCGEILKPEWNYDYIFCACGTATTYSGILLTNKPGQVLVGISVLKGENTLPGDVVEMLSSLGKKKIEIAGNEEVEKKHIRENCILNTYAFKGYARLDEALIEYKNGFEKKYHVPLDHVYTTKLMYAVFDLMKKQKLKAGSKLLVIHSGGLQGNKGFEERYHLMPNL